MANKALIAILFLSGVSVMAQQPAYQRIESVRGQVNDSQPPAVSSPTVSAPQPNNSLSGQSVQQPASPSGASAAQPASSSSGQSAPQPASTRPTSIADVSRRARGAPPASSSGTSSGLQQKSLADIARERRVTTPVNPTKVSSTSTSRKKGASHRKHPVKTSKT